MSIDYCRNCPDHEACAQNTPCYVVRSAVNSRIPGHGPECVGCERDAWRKGVSEQRRPSPTRALLRRWFGYRPDRIEVYRGPEPAAEPYDD